MVSTLSKTLFLLLWCCWSCMNGHQVWLKGWPNVQSQRTYRDPSEGRHLSSMGKETVNCSLQRRDAQRHMGQWASRWGPQPGSSRGQLEAIWKGQAAGLAPRARSRITSQHQRSHFRLEQSGTQPDGTEHHDTGRAGLDEHGTQTYPLTSSNTTTTMIDILTHQENWKTQKEEQSMHFKYFIYAEGHCGWADRLKWQLMSGSVPIVQSTTCGFTTTPSCCLCQRPLLSGKNELHNFD